MIFKIVEYLFYGGKQFSSKVKHSRFDILLKYIILLKWQIQHIKIQRIDRSIRFHMI